MQQSYKPLARSEGLVVQEMDGELLVYDVTADKAHSLNATSAAVWKACDGANTVAGLSAMFDAQAGAAHGESLVLLALDQFRENELLQNAVEVGASFSRRDLVRRIGLTSMMALPMIASLAMPNNAMAQQPACQCVNPGGCITQTTCPSTVNCNGSGVCAP